MFITNARPEGEQQSSITRITNS